MKFYVKTQQYKASNVRIDTHAPLTAYSYDWYELAKVIDGELIFNTFNYSSSTIKHKYKVRACLTQDMNLTIDHEIEAPQGLQNLPAALEHYEFLIVELANEIEKPRSHKTKNIERLEKIKEHQAKIKLIKKLMKRA